jgi:magnesium-transporting ATPase (P-type)
MTIDLRRYTSQTTVRLIFGALVLLFVVGLGLIWLFYGLGAALMGLLCMLGALIPMGLIWLFMIGLDLLVKKLNEE